MSSISIILQMILIYVNIYKERDQICINKVTPQTHVHEGLLVKCTTVVYVDRLSRHAPLAFWRAKFSNFPSFSVADEDLQIRGSPGHPDPEIRGSGGGLKKIFFGPSGLSLV